MTDLAADEGKGIGTSGIGALGAVLDAPPPAVSLEEAALLARDLFGLQGRLRPLGGERDRNFHLVAEDGAEYLFKVVHPEEPEAVSDFQSRGLLHLAATDPGLPVPRVRLPLAGGSPQALWQPQDGRPACRVRALSFLPGRPLHGVPPSAALRQAVGRFLARLDAALEGFRHPSEDHELMWDIQHAARLRGLIGHFPVAEDRDLAWRMLDRFEARALPLLPGLRRQVIHNDFNPHNVLADAVLDDAVGGVIDFGDMVRAPLVQDLATACAYQLQPEGHPLAGPADLLRGFLAVRPLEEAEFAVLGDLIATRLVISVAISGWRAVRQPENAEYVLRNTGRALTALRRLGELPEGAAQDWLRQAIRE